MQHTTLRAAVARGVTGPEATRGPFLADLPSWLVLAAEPAPCRPDARGRGARAHAPAPRVE